MFLTQLPSGARSPKHLPSSLPEGKEPEKTQYLSVVPTESFSLPCYASSLWIECVFALCTPGTIVPGTDSFMETGLILKQFQNVSVHPVGKGVAAILRMLQKMGYIKGNKK